MSARQRSFSQFTLADALAAAGIADFEDWSLEAAPRPPSAHFAERMRRLEAFDTERSEGAKLLLVDTFLEEAIQPYKKLRVFKESPLKAPVASGVIDYLVTRRAAVPLTPLLCVAEAKKDDFDAGLAQCLVEMQAAAQTNETDGRRIDIYGIVTNGATWQFCRRQTTGEVARSDAYVASDAPKLLGVLDYLFARCEENIG